MNVLSRPATAPAVWAARIIMALAGTLILAFSAKLQIPFWPVPMTLQTLAVMLIASGGWRFAAATFALYLSEGALGLPVFAGTPERGIGLAYMAGPTGGYLLGFFLASLIVGLAAERGARNKPVLLFIVMMASLALVYAIGVLWLSQFISADQLLALGVLPFLAGDIVKIALACALTAVAQYKRK